MSAPLLIALATLALAVLATGARRQAALGSAITAGGAALIGLLALVAPLDVPFTLLGMPFKFAPGFQLLGRSLTLDESNRAAVAFLYLSGAFVFGGAWAARPARAFFPVGVLALGTLASSLMVRPFLYAAVFLEMAAMGAVLILETPGRGQGRAGLRLVTLYTLAMMTILVAGWQIEALGISAGAPELALQATLPLALGVAILLAVPPFHHWLPAAAQRAHPYALGFVAVFLPSAGLFLLLRFLDIYPWLRESAALFDGMRLVGAVMVFFGAWLALAQTRFLRMLAYALVADLGVTLIAVGCQTPDGYRLALGLIGVHAVGLTVCSLGLWLLQEQAGGDQAQVLAGAGRGAPLAAAAALAGLFSLAGFPLAAGFPNRWALLSLLAPRDALAAAAVLAGVLGVTAAALRWAATLLTAAAPVPRAAPGPARAFLLLSGVLLCLLLGTFPQALTWLFDATRGFTNLVP